MTKEIKLKDLKTDAKVCGNCRFSSFEPSSLEIHCHRYPPVIFPETNDIHCYQDRPLMKELDWCGEFKLKTENQKKLGLA